MTRRLVTHENPEGRQTPLLLLAELRVLEPLIELVYFGGNDWRLGAVRPTTRRWRAGQIILAQQADLPDRHRNPKNIMLGRLYVQGFAQIAQYTDFGDPSGEVLDADLDERCTILANFTRRDHNARTAPEETFQAGLDEAGGASRKAEAEARFHDTLGNDVRGHYRREMHGHTSFGYGGQTGGRGKHIITPAGMAGPILTGRQAADAMEEMMHAMAAGL